MFVCPLSQSVFLLPSHQITCRLRMASVRTLSVATCVPLNISFPLHKGWGLQAVGHIVTTLLPVSVWWFIIYIWFLFHVRMIKDCTFPSVFFCEHDNGGVFCTQGWNESPSESDGWGGFEYEPFPRPISLWSGVGALWESSPVLPGYESVYR